MITTDPIADFLIRLKNANRAGKTEVMIPFSKMKQHLADLLSKEGYIGEVSRRGNKPQNPQSPKKTAKNLLVTLTYKDGKPAIVGTKRLSKPSRRIYMGVHDVRPVKRGRGLLVLSTPKGILTDAQARKEHAGGEALFEIW